MIASLFKPASSTDYREVLRVCLPLVLSMSATTVMEFTDRVFLSNYSIEAISAAAPAGITAYLFLAFFGGVGGYAGVFIAQYFGSGNHKRIGEVLWQGIYFTLFTGFICYLIALYGSGPIFKLAGHTEEVRILEEQYFSILCKGAVFHIATSTLSTFFTGRGITRPVLIITLIAVLINIPLNYTLIFGKWGMAEMGIEGAAIATVVSWIVSTLLLVGLTFTRKNNGTYNIFSGRRFNTVLMSRLLKYGVPGSLQFTMDILAFTLFILMVGQIGTLELAATNIVLSINAVAFMPSMGVSQGISVMVGQSLGRRDADEAKRVVKSAIHLLLVYIFMVDILFIAFPEFILSPFIQSTGDSGQFRELAVLSVQLLKIISIYLLLDAMYMVFSGALKGAGDTRFLLFAIGTSAIFFLGLPVYFGIKIFDMGVHGAWFCVVLFIIVLFTLSALRYRAGRWQTMLVIEKEAVNKED